MKALLAKKSLFTLSVVAMLALLVVGVVGLYYLSQLAYADCQNPDGSYCGNLTKNERMLARIAIVIIWLQFAWLSLPIWKQGYAKIMG